MAGKPLNVSVKLHNLTPPRNILMLIDNRKLSDFEIYSHYSRNIGKDKILSEKVQEWLKIIQNRENLFLKLDR